MEEFGGDFQLDIEQHSEWMKILNLDEDATASDFVLAAGSGGDAVMSRMWKYVQSS